MASYSQFLGRRVTVQYRIGDVVLPASGLFSADSGRSIFLEQHIEQGGKRSYFRWEIPYHSIHRIEEMPEEAKEPEPALPDGQKDAGDKLRASAAAAGQASSGGSTVLPAAHRRFIRA
jgi:hypothetical protein